MLFGYDVDGAQVRVGDRVRCVGYHYMAPEDAVYFQDPSDTYSITALSPTPTGLGVTAFCDVCRHRDGKLSRGWFIERFKLVPTQDDTTTVTRRLTVKQNTSGVPNAGG